MQTTIQPVSDLDMAFGPSNLSALLPAWKDIPDEFKHGNGKWNQLASAWFFTGLSELKLAPKDGVDTQKAMRHIRAILVSFEPQHQHKEAGVAYLLSQWFTDASWKPAARQSVESSVEPSTR